MAKKTTLVAASLLALGGLSLALTACAGQSASEYALERDKVAQEQLDAQCTKARQLWDEAAEANMQHLEGLVRDFVGAVTTGDVQWLEGNAGSVITGHLESSLVGDAWNGAQSFEVEVAPTPAREFPGCPQVDQNWGRALEGVSKKQAFGNSEYIPTVQGVPWTEVQMPTFGEDQHSSVPLSFALNGETTTSCLWAYPVGDRWEIDMETSDCGFMQAASFGGLLSAGAQDFRVGNTTLGALFKNRDLVLPGTYRSESDPFPDSEWVQFSQPLDSIDLAESFVLEATEALVARSEEAIEEWIGLSMGLVNSDSRCDVGFGWATDEMQGVKVALLPTACADSRDASTVAIERRNPAVVTSSSSYFDKDGGEITLRFQTENEEPVLITKAKDRYNSSGWYRHETKYIDVTYKLDASGNVQPMGNQKFIVDVL